MPATCRRRPRLRALARSRPRRRPRSPSRRRRRAHRSARQHPRGFPPRGRWRAHRHAMALRRHARRPGALPRGQPRRADSQGPRCHRSRRQGQARQGSRRPAQGTRPRPRQRWSRHHQSRGSGGRPLSRPETLARSPRRPAAHARQRGLGKSGGGRTRRAWWPRHSSGRAAAGRAVLPAHHHGGAGRPRWSDSDLHPEVNLARPRPADRLPLRAQPRPPARRHRRPQVCDARRMALRHTRR